jgi:hypothetical protein
MIKLSFINLDFDGLILLINRVNHKYLLMREMKYQYFYLPLFEKLI